MIFFRNNAPGWPSREKQQLLKAIYLKGKDAKKAWAHCSRELKVDRNYDIECYTLISMVYQNLCAIGVQDDSLSKVKGAYRKEWYKTQRIIYEASRILAAFNALDIKTIFPKDVGLHFYYYKDAFRPIYAIDILVNGGDLAKAAESVKGMGWEEVPDGSFKDEQGHVLYLKKDLFEWPAFKGYEEQFRMRARPVLIKGHGAYVLNPTDQLLYLCVCAAFLGTAIYVGDAAKVIESSRNELEWKRFAAESKTNQVSGGAKALLAAVEVILRTPIPTEVAGSV